MMETVDVIVVIGPDNHIIIAIKKFGRIFPKIYGVNSLDVSRSTIYNTYPMQDIGYFKDLGYKEVYRGIMYISKVKFDVFSHIRDELCKELPELLV